MTEIVQAELIPTLKDRWPAIQAVRHELAIELDQMAADLPGERRQKLRLLSRWFRGPADLADALTRADVLSVCVPLLTTDKNPDSVKQMDSSSPSISPTEISHAALVGFSSLGQSVSVSRRVMRMLIYPLLVLLGCCLLGIGFSFVVAPPFIEMFEEFGVQLPAMTKLVFGTSYWVRRGGWILLVAPIGGGLLFLLLHLVSDVWFATQLGQLDRWLTRTRVSLAEWAWHLALLMDARIPADEAFNVAGKASGRSWLRRLSDSLVSAGSRQSNEVSSKRAFNLCPKFQLLHDVLKLPASSEKNDLLRVIARSYWDRSSNIGDWWIHLLMAFMLFVTALGILFVVMAMFMPLFAIIGGLTGG